MDMKKILQAMDGIATKPVEGSNDMKKFLQVVTEGSNPHKVALPVQMAMQHYQQPKEEKVIKESSLLKKYFAEAEEELEQELVERKEHLKMYSQQVAQRVMEKAKSLRTSNPCWTGYHPVGTKKKGGKTVPNCVPKE
jgi:hypothetical protein